MPLPLLQAELVASVVPAHLSTGARGRARATGHGAASLTSVGLGGPEWPEALPPDLLDWRWGLARLGQRDGLYFSLLARFGESITRLQVRLAQAATRADLAGVAQAARSIKGGALLVGAWPLAQRADQVDELAQAADAGLQQALVSLAQVLARTERRVAAVLLAQDRGPGGQSLRVS